MSWYLATLVVLAISLLCLGGLVLSVVSLSGTWLVLAAAAIAAVAWGEEFPGAWTLVTYALLAAGVEVLEAVAGHFGVKRRGGSTWAGLAAMAGGIAGLFFGGVIPIPIVGSLIGMTACGFGAAYWVEYGRMKRRDHALYVATGVILARVFVLLVKVLVTLGMIIHLVTGLALWRHG